MKAILLVAYHYPPEGSSSGVLRTLKYTKYLSEHGWQPHVLTLKENLYHVKDLGLLKDVHPEVVIHRTHAWNSAKDLAIRGRYFAIFSIPDRFVTWLPFGVARGLKVIRKWPIGALYSTSPQPTAHLIAGFLKKLKKIPWIADFRDPWIEEGLFPTPGTLRYRVESKLEEWVIRNADAVTVTTPRLREELLKRYPKISNQKIFVIYNGYDEEDFQRIENTRPPDCFEIIHAGLLTREYRNPYPLLKVLSVLLEERKIARENVRLTLVGGGRFLLSKEFRETITQLGLSDVVQIEDRIPNAEALRRMAGASALLLLQATDDTSTLIPAKAFEYLRINKPILAMTGEGATADLLQGMSECHIVNPLDQESLMDAMQQLYAQWSQGGNEGHMTSRAIQKFERKHLTKELVTILNYFVK